MSNYRSGQDVILQGHYERLKLRAAAYIDETYSFQEGFKTFYVMSAVIVSSDDRDALRKELDELVPDGWWHTVESLRREGGREDTITMLNLIEAPHNACVIVETFEIAEGEDEEGARSRALSRLLVAVAQHEEHDVGLVVVEARKTQKQDNLDRRTRATLVAAGKIPNGLEMVITSPSVEHLLWLPDAVCSARREEIVHGKRDLIQAIEASTLTQIRAAIKAA